MKSSDSKAKVVDQTRGFTKVQRSRAGVACAGGEMHRKMAPRSRKLELRFRFHLVLVFDFFRAREVGGAGEGAGVLLLT